MIKLGRNNFARNVPAIILIYALTQSDRLGYSVGSETLLA